MRIECAIDDLIETSEKKVAIRQAKAHDYANEDCLSNFKVMADIAKVMKQRGYEIDTTKPWGVAMWHLMHKIVRIVRLYNDESTPENESVADSHLDLELYSQLCKECYQNEHGIEKLYNPT